jgi:hypothetical protein
MAWVDLRHHGLVMTLPGGPDVEVRMMECWRSRVTVV